ncbi:hypothetical protein MBLNU230_g0473t1 [Neophaeotheca triangularis]
MDFQPGSFGTYLQNAVAGNVSTQNDIPLHEELRSFLYDTEKLDGLNADEIDADFNAFGGILEVFARQRFIYFSDENYRVMEKPCRLASQLLQTLPAFELLKDMMHNDNTILIQRSDKTPEGLLRLNKTSTESDPQWKTNVYRGLARLAEHIIIQTEDLPPGTCASARSGPDLPPPSPPSQAAAGSLDFYPQRAPYISIGTRKFMKLARMRECRLKGEKYDQAVEVWAIFDMATSLVHELAHAVWFAVGLDNTWGDPLYGDGKVAELGFELTSAIFGGDVAFWPFGVHENNYPFYGSMSEEHHGILTFVPWPSRSLARLYEDDGEPMPSRPGTFISPHETLTRVPFKEIHKFLTKAFWQRLNRWSHRTADRFCLANVGCDATGAIRETTDGWEWDLDGVNQPFQLPFILPWPN